MVLNINFCYSSFFIYFNLSRNTYFELLFLLIFSFLKKMISLIFNFFFFSKDEILRSIYTFISFLKPHF